jgi:hypothetical protein
LLGLELPKLTFVDGSLVIGAIEAVLDLDFPVLASVGSDLTIAQAFRLREIVFPKLLAVEGVLGVNRSERLAGVRFPELRQAAGGVVLFDVKSLATVDLARMETAGGLSIKNAGTELGSLRSVKLDSLRTLSKEFYVGHSSGTPTFDAPRLESAGAFAFESVDFPEITGFPALASVGADLVIQKSSTTSVTGFDSLESVGKDVWILDNAALTDLSGLRAIRTVAGNFTLQGCPTLSELTMDLESARRLEIRRNGVGTIDLARLERGSQIFIVENGGLACLHMPSLTSVIPATPNESAIFSVVQNYSLAGCQVDAIIARIMADGLIATNAYNDETGTCEGGACR